MTYFVLTSALSYDMIFVMIHYKYQKVCFKHLGIYSTYIHIENSPSFI